MTILQDIDKMNLRILQLLLGGRAGFSSIYYKFLPYKLSHLLAATPSAL